MAKRKRVKKRTVLGIIEGEKAEKNLLTFLNKIYLDQNCTSLKVPPKHGGSPGRLIEIAKKNLHCGFDVLFVWIDEDVELSDDAKEILFGCWSIAETEREKFFSCQLRDLQRLFNSGKRNPILIVSQPVCVEALIIRTLGRSLTVSQYDSGKRREQVRQLKSALAGIIQQSDHIEFYEKNLTKEAVDQRRLNIEELDLLIQMITG